MPELPEVETIKLGLQRKIIGLTIKDVQVVSANTFGGQAGDLKGKQVLRVWRRAKILGIDLSEGQTLLFHLKMTGQLVYDDGKRRIIGGHPTPDMRNQMPTSSTRVIFEFSNGSKLYFNDQRRFGWVRVVESGKLPASPAQRGEKVESLLTNLGPEPLDPTFTWQVLKQNLLKHKGLPVKMVLMDQKVVAGVGNIYASEACFNAKIDPRRKVKDLSDAEFKRLHGGIIQSLKEGIKHGGSTIAHFVDPEGKKGYFLDYAYVYGRDGMMCKACGTGIKKTAISGRGTYYCPKCQQ